MIAPNSPIDPADLQALATLATAKLGTPYAFAPFAGIDEVGLPANLTVVATPPGSNLNPFPGGTKFTLWLYSYKTIGGVKTYSFDYVYKAYYDKTGAAFLLKFSWESPTGDIAPDGYIAIAPAVTGAGEANFFWKDIGNINTILIDGNFNFAGNNESNQDVSYIPSKLINIPGLQDTPCAHGIWTKNLMQIYHDTMLKLDLFGGPIPFNPATHCVSGPWVISAGPKCYLTFPGMPGTAGVPLALYENVKFYFSLTDNPTGDHLSIEADLNSPVAAANGANNFTLDTSGQVNGTITFFTTLGGQGAADWTLTASDPSITTSFDTTSSPTQTGLVFTFTNTPATAGAPITLTLTPHTGGGLQPGNFACTIAATLTPPAIAQPRTDNQPIINLSDSGGSYVALANNLPNVTITTVAGNIVCQSHWRAFCDGCFVANTLPTLGIMPFVDADLPNYLSPSIQYASSQRIPRTNAQGNLPAGQPYMPVIDNCPSIWPVMLDTDFIPDDLGGQPFKGSKAWQALASKLVTPLAYSLNPVPVPAGGFASSIVNIIALSSDPDQVRVYLDNPDAQLYLKFNGQPTLSDFDAGPFTGGTWNTLDATTPNFGPGAQLFVGIYNPTTDQIVGNAYAVEIDSGAHPNGNFFLVSYDDSNNPFPALELESYLFDNPFAPRRPVPQFGYCIYSVTVRRQPQGTPARAPSDGTADLDVNLGIMQDWGWDAEGTFQNIQTVTIPAGQPSVTVEVFWPVVSGTFLVVQCEETVIVRPAVNFQPMMHAGFDLQQQSTILGGAPVTFAIGYYDGPPGLHMTNPGLGNLTYLIPLFFPDGGNTDALGVMLPICAVLPNDLNALLNTF